jgi:putative phosphoribosyl transferase
MNPPVVFKNRIEAARLLAKELARFRGKNSLVLGVPRGAVPMADAIARDLRGELGVVLVRKIPAPTSVELAIASIGESGTIYDSPRDYEVLASENYIKEEGARQLERIKNMRRDLGFGPEPSSYKGRIVIIVDDGIATGSSMLAAVNEIKRKNPDQIILAVPVISPQALDLLYREVNEIVALHVPERLYAVGIYYADFSQVSDEEVRKIFNRKNEPVKNQTPRENVL